MATKSERGSKGKLPRAVIIGEDKRGRLISTPVPPNVSNDLAHQLADSDGFAPGTYKIVSRQKAIEVASEIVRAANARCS